MQLNKQQITRFLSPSPTLFFPFVVLTEKPEESQAAKPAKKKKARRETWDRVRSADLCMQKDFNILFMQHLLWREL